MPVVKEDSANRTMGWKYIFIIFVLASLVGWGTLEFSAIENKISEIRLPPKSQKLEKIKQGKEFLYRMEDPNEHGFHKYYYALDDSFEERLHTVYSASIIYTFLYIYDLDYNPPSASSHSSLRSEWAPDKKILENLPNWGDFLLSMQNKDSESKRYGAFYYSYYLDSKEKEKKFVTGTAALSIFTLLRLYDLTGEEKYLESARLAGDWLITMQKENGSMKPYIRYSDGKWVHGTKESLLYNGQVLSALSKLYAKTQDEKYFDCAQKIADRFAEKYEKEQGYIEGEYRKKNPISNSWVVMSLMDFYQVNPDLYYKDIIFELSQKILENQIDDGHWQGAYSSSGNGWISEVMAETYRFCQGQGRGDCQKYKEAVAKVIPWLWQLTFTKENSSSLKNPERAIGGVFWNENNKYVRTDSVCHALNGYIRIIE